MFELKLNERCLVVWGREEMVIHLRGPLGVLEAQDLSGALETVLVCRPGRLIVDLSSVEMMGSVALAALIALRRSVKTYGGTLSVRGMRERVLGTVRVAGLAGMLGVK